MQQVLAGWTVAIIALLTLLYTVRSGSEKAAERRLMDKLSPISEALDRHDLSHETHFRAEAAAKEAIGSLTVTIAEHKSEDDKRFDANEEMLREIRDDIKQLLSRGNA